MTALQQTLRHMKADEPGRTGYENRLLGHDLKRLTEKMASSRLSYC
jgi:hypothetical protein